MKVSREQMAQNRIRILTEAARLFREKGFAAVSVAEVMKAAGLNAWWLLWPFQIEGRSDCEAIGFAAGARSDTADLGSFDAYL